MVRLALGAALGLAVVAVGGVVLGQRALVHHPDRSAPPPAADLLPGGRDVTLTTADGLELAAWWVPPPDGCRSTVLVAHGNGGHRGHRAALAGGLVDRGFGVLLLDYRGYGGNPGRPSERGLALDVRAARAFLHGHGLDDGDLVLLGESLGTAVVAELAAAHPPAALVLRSPFPSLADVARAAYGLPVGPLLRDRFEAARHLAAVTVPIAVLHGDRDAVVPQRLSVAVADVARAAGADVVEVEVQGAGHDDPALGHGPPLLDAVVEVARRGGAPPCGGPGVAVRR